MSRWVEIPDCRFRYRINEEGQVQRQLENGSWRDIQTSLLRGSNRATVNLTLANGKRRNVAVAMLMANAFMGGKTPGIWIVHRNGLRTDNRLENLEAITPEECGKRYGSSGRRKPVVKIDRNGEVVETYRSAAEAAKKNHIGRSPVTARCRKEVPHEKEYDTLGGFTFRYEK